MIEWILSAAAALPILAWLAVWLRPSWVVDEEEEPSPPLSWPPVTALVPARNEAALLPRTLPALLAQDYPGSFRIVVIDDRSEDETARVAANFDVTVVRGAALPDGWVGKVWALEQGLRQTSSPYVLLTDADIVHEPSSLRRLVAESERDGLVLNSRMARLRCESAAERLLVPAYVWFFNLLYPMKGVNEGRIASAAGGCMLVTREGLDRIGGCSRIKDAVIDDVELAKAIGHPQRLSMSRSRVRSVREYGTVGSIWRMVRRTAFTELRHSWWRLAAALAILGFLFLAPPAMLAAGFARSEWFVLGASGALTWLLMWLLYRPAVRFFGANPAWAWTLPVIGLLYGLMTLDSALRSSRK